MTFTGPQTALIICVAIVVAYPLVMRGLAAMVQPARLELAEVGRDILALRDVPDVTKDAVRLLLQDVYEWRIMPALALAMPALVVSRALRAKSVGLWTVGSPDARARIDRFMRLYLGSAAAANPIFTIVVAVEFVALFAVLYPVGKLQQLRDLLYGAVGEADRHFSHG